MSTDDDISERIGAAIHTTAASVDAPAALHSRVSPGRQTVAPARRRRGVVALAAAATALAVAFVVTGTLLVTGDSGRGPSVADAAPLALRQATSPPPALDRVDSHFIQAEVGGVKFPNYAYDTPWKTLGARRDEVSGRRAMTVLYSAKGGPVGYTIVDGKPLEIPDGARKLTVAGRSFWILDRDGAPVVTWRQNGRTCIVSGRNATPSQLLEFAAWR